MGRDALQPCAIVCRPSLCRRRAARGGASMIDMYPAETIGCHGVKRTRKGCRAPQVRSGAFLVRVPRCSQPAACSRTIDAEVIVPTCGARQGRCKPWCPMPLLNHRRRHAPGESRTSTRPSQASTRRETAVAGEAPAAPGEPRRGPPALRPCQAAYGGRTPSQGRTFCAICSRSRTITWSVAGITMTTAPSAPASS